MTLERNQWAVVEADNRTVHIVPLAEHHLLSRRCPCEPEQDQVAKIMWIHRRAQ